MKKLILILSVFFAITIIANAQIPNNSFENWITQNEIEIPSVPWVTNNLQEKPLGVTFNPVTKSTDHFPNDVGSYSLRMENNISYLSEIGELLPYWACSYGYTTTAFYPGFFGPVFPITGHPNTLYGYYKFIPQNNDTMFFSISLYYNGVVVSSAYLSSNITVSDWASFSIPLPSYVNADSAQIGFSAFNIESGYPSGPHGNSILYIDNLSFDNLIIGVSENIFKSSMFTLSPNPASDLINLNMDNPMNSLTIVNIYNVSGALIRSESILTNQQQINVADLSNGFYLIEIKTKDWTEKQKLIIKK